MAAAADKELWLYVDAATGQQKGPLAGAILKRLLRKGLLQPQQFVWTQRLSEWQPLAQVDAFAAYCATWCALWYYMVDDLDAGPSATKQAGPVATKELVALFLDGEIDGMTLVWSKDMAEWSSISEVPSLKEFLHEANEDQAREEEVLEKQSQVAVEDQVFKDEKVEAFVAEDGKQYIFDTEGKKWVTPEDKIEEDLQALREAAGESKEDHEVAQEVKQKKKNQANKNNGGDGVNKENENENDTTAAADNGESAKIASTASSADSTDNAEQRKPKKKKKKKSEKWQRSKNKTWVYVNGLPLDITVQEVHDHFAKCGVIQQDLVTSTPRIKLYENKEFGGLNGDGSVCYMKEASVELAIQLLDKSEIRPEWPIDVSPAVFEQKGSEFVKRKKLKLDSRAKVKKIEQEKALSWNEGGDGDKNGLRIVVIKHMFTPEEIEDEAYENELRDDILAECLKIGEVTKITLFSKHADGVVVVKFESTGAAATCLDVMNGRFFAGRKLECSFWDGTDYTYRESKDEENERAEKFSEWLEQGSSSSEAEDESDDEDTADGKENVNEIGAAPSAATVHAGRVMPDLDDDDEEDDSEDENVPVAEAVHAGRVMPDLDDVDDDEDE
uniref:RRM domain-containing protein n=1 Tax=Globisporangium ultimum (strain ATCC 200006 / CBS 805.95 / DAOM BR144) TaxID=431595 RepID=K3WEI1_GLOUD